MAALVCLGCRSGRQDSTSSVKAGAKTACKKAYEQCTFAPGKLGVCMPQACPGKSEGTCLTCTSQH